MNVLSLFDGMSCGQIALKELGIKVSRYYASEIDKYAIKQTQYNFPNTVQLGSVEKWKEWDIDWKSINLVLAGSPCQGFSFAGKQLAFNDPRSRLFFIFIDILNHIKDLNPNVKFLLENVNMKRSHMGVISEHCGVYPVNINSNLVSAQNRNRWYWTNVRTRQEGLLSELTSDIPQPTDEGVLLRDILEADVDERFYLTKKFENWLEQHAAKRGTLVKRLNGNSKASCLTTTEAKRNLSNDYICVAMRGRNPENPSSRVSGLPTEQRLEANTSGKTNCLTSVAKDNLVMCLTPKRTEFGKQVRKEYERGTVSYMRKEISSLKPRGDEKTNTLTGVQKDNLLMDGFRTRRLTPIECARLQTIPDWYEWVVSDTQIYKMCGNGWTVKVIMWILRFLKE